MNDADPAAISATYRAVKTMADGTPRVTLDLDCTLEAAAKILGLPGDVVAVARLTKKAAKETVSGNGGAVYSDDAMTEKVAEVLEWSLSDETLPAEDYGEQAKALKLSSFFRTPKVWEAIGSDEEFAEWIQKQKCCICGGGDWVEKLGEMRCEAAHVRRAGESGTGYKANYARVPMCHEHHAHQHQHGELSVLRLRTNIARLMGDIWVKSDADMALTVSEWFDKKRIEYVQAWGWKTLKAGLGYESWKDVPPQELRDWATVHGLEQYLPSEYR